MIKDINQFRSERKEQYQAAIELNDIINTIIKNISNITYTTNPMVALIGFLKSGKREIIECLSIMMNETCKIYYATSLLRKDMKDQLEEFEEYNKKYKNLAVLNFTNKKDKNSFDEKYDKHKIYVIFFDEGDYGDNINQQFDVFRNKYSNNSNIIYIPTSATLYSFMDIIIKKPNIQYVVSKVANTYYGLDKPQLISIHNSAFQFHKNQIIGLDSYFEQILVSWLRQDKYTRFIVREISMKDTNTNQLQSKIDDLRKRYNIDREIDCILVNEKNSYKWKRKQWEGFELIIVKQTFTRGTETNIHPYLYGYYDHRNDKAAMNTLLQALGRFAGYNDNTHIKFYLSYDGINVVNANTYMEKNLALGTPMNVIFDTLHTKFGITKLSKNTAISSNISRANTREWKKITYKQNTNNTDYCDKNYVNKGNIFTNALKANGNPNGRTQDEQTIYIEIENIDDILLSVEDDILKKDIQDAKIKFNIKSTEKVLIEGTLISQSEKIVNRSNTSTFNQLIN